MPVRIPPVFPTETEMTEFHRDGSTANLADTIDPFPPKQKPDAVEPPPPPVAANSRYCVPAGIVKLCAASET